MRSCAVEQALAKPKGRIPWKWVGEVVIAVAAVLQILQTVGLLDLLSKVLQRPEVPQAIRATARVTLLVITALLPIAWPVAVAALAYWLALRQIRKESTRVREAVVNVAVHIIEEQERLTKEQVAKLRSELRPPLSTEAMARALRRLVQRGEAKEQQGFEAWEQGKVESLMAGQGNFIKIGSDEQAWAARAVREGRLRWGPIAEIPGVMLPETALDE